MLYWAEGSKKRTQLFISNTDSALLQLFVRFLRECYGVELEQLRVSFCAYLNNGYTADEIKGYWLKELGLPASSYRNSDIRVGSTTYAGCRHPYGVGYLSLARSGFILNSIYGAIQEYSGVDNPEWQS
jgi:hypothetical protein